MAQIQVIASTDDCYRRLTSSYWNVGATQVNIGAGAHGGTSYQVGSGMRFTNIPIPQGSIINSAYLTLRCSSAQAGDDCNTRISAEDVDDAVTFADNSAAFDTRWAARTTARVDWDAIPAWTLNTDYNSPEIKTVIQEIIDRAGWASGQDIVIFWEDFEDRSTHDDYHRRLAYSYDGSSTYAPKLIINLEPQVSKRGISHNISVKLYDKNLATPTFVDNLTDKIADLRFTTKLHGGFGLCSFRLKADLPKAWDWITNRIFYRLIVEDGEKTLFEGRLEDITINPASVYCVFYGYYVNLKDIPYTTAYNAVASVVIKAVLTANCAQISSDQTNIDATDITITSAADSTYLDIYPSELVEKLLAFSDTNKYKYYFAIWEDRIPYSKARSVTSIDWQVNLEDLTRFSLTHRGSEMWNSCYAIYEGASPDRTEEVADTESQDKYPERKYVVPNLGAVALGAAEAQRDIVLEERKDIWPTMENITLGDTVFNANGVPFPSSWVRAGEVLRIKDLVPVSTDAGTVVRDALRTFYIVGTDYNANTRTNRVTIDTEAGDLVSQLARRL